MHSRNKKFVGIKETFLFKNVFNPDFDYLFEIPNKLLNTYKLKIS